MEAAKDTKFGTKVA